MTTVILVLLLPVYLILFWLVKVTLGNQNDEQQIENPFLNIGDSLPSVIFQNKDGDELNINQLDNHILLFVKKSCGSCKQILSSLNKENSNTLNNKVVIISSEMLERDQVPFQADYITDSKVFNLFNIRIVPTAMLIKKGKIETSIIVKNEDDLINLLPNKPKNSSVTMTHVSHFSGA